MKHYRKFCGEYVWLTDLGLRIAANDVLRNLQAALAEYRKVFPDNGSTKGVSYGAGLTQKVTKASKTSLNQIQQEKHSAAPSPSWAQFS